MDLFRPFMSHFFIGMLGALLIFLFFYRRAGIQSFSLPTAVILVGLYSAVSAIYVSPWCTPIILALYAIATAEETKT